MVEIVLEVMVKIHLKQGNNNQNTLVVIQIFYKTNIVYLLRPKRHNGYNWPHQARNANLIPPTSGLYLPPPPPDPPTFLLPNPQSDPDPERNSTSRFLQIKNNSLNVF